MKVCCISYAAYDILLWQPEQTATGISKHHLDSLGLVFQTPQRGPRNTRCSLSRPPNVQLWLGKSRISNSNVSSATFASCSQAGYSGTRCFHIQTRKHNYIPMNAIARSTVTDYQLCVGHTGMRDIVLNRTDETSCSQTADPLLREDR